jgi:hypothetical protein
MYAEEAKQRQRGAGGDKKSDEYKKSVPENFPEAVKDRSSESREKAAAEVGVSGKLVSDYKVEKSILSEI